jgi:hypothetical protein
MGSDPLYWPRVAIVGTIVVWAPGLASNPRNLEQFVCRRLGRRRNSACTAGGRCLACCGVR